MRIRVRFHMRSGTVAEVKTETTSDDGTAVSVAREMYANIDFDKTTTFRLDNVVVRVHELEFIEVVEDVGDA